MDTQLLEKHFRLLGARAKFFEIPAADRRQRPGIDIGTDQSGEFFDIRIAGDEEVAYEVVDLDKPLRHLLLMAKRPNGKEKFLCGHDERHWFVCAVPGGAVTDVRKAMEALQPAAVRWRAARNVKRHKNRLARRNEAFVRQGEWFFIPLSDLDFKGDFPNQIHKNEPLSRGLGSKPHICREVFRSRGQSVMVCTRYPRGVTMKRYSDLVRQNPKAGRWDWRVMQINAAVYARGTVRHPDHKTIVLHGWHQVFMNTENEAPGMRHVVFLD